MAIRGISNGILQEILNKIGVSGTKSPRSFKNEAKEYLEKGIEEQSIDSSINIDLAIDELNQMMTEQNPSEKQEENNKEQ